MLSMRKITFFGSMPWVLGCAALVACGDDPTSSPVSQTANVDALLSEVGASQSLSNFGMTLGGAVALSIAAQSSYNCPYSAPSKTFICPDRTVQGLTFKNYYQLLDPSDAPQSAFNTSTTAAIRTVSDVSGTINLTVPIAVTGHNEQTLSGLLTSSHVLNGTGTSTQTMSLTTTPLTLTTAETISNLVQPKNGHKSPESGTISVEMSSGTSGVTSRITMSFNGTSTVTMEMTFGGTTRTCTMDLESPVSFSGCL
jgi:hypothetical protein